MRVARGETETEVTLTASYPDLIGAVAATALGLRFTPIDEVGDGWSSAPQETWINGPRSTLTPGEIELRLEANPFSIGLDHASLGEVGRPHRLTHRIVNHGAETRTLDWTAGSVDDLTVNGVALATGTITLAPGADHLLTLDVASASAAAGTVSVTVNVPGDVYDIARVAYGVEMR